MEEEKRSGGGDLENKVPLCSSSLAAAAPSPGGTETGVMTVTEPLLDRSGNGGVGVVVHCVDESFGGSGSKMIATGSDSDNNMSKEGRGGGNSEMEVTPPVAGCSSSSAGKDGGIIFANRQETRDDEGGLDGCHHLSVVPSRKKMNPRDLLPPEIWLLVFDKVKHPQDWLNLYRTSSTFQEVVGDKRTTALFPQVVRHVIPYLGKNSVDIIGLRLVCRSWKTDVDNLLESPGSVSAQIQRQLEQCYYLHSSADISSFLEQFEAHSRNPFVGRFISFKFDYIQSSEVIAESGFSAARLLDKFGSQIKTLSVEVRDTNSDNCVPQLQTFLQFTPNLVSLRVHFRQHYDRRQGGALVESLQRGPLPFLPHLKSISFSEAGAGEVRTLLKLQTAVVRLTCNPNLLKSVEVIGVPSEVLAYPNVESAVVSFQEKEDYSTLAVASAAWPLLSKLTVRGSFGDDLRSFLECIEYFKATLTSLCFQHGVYPNRTLNLKKLDLPQLKQLTIHWHYTMSLEFFTNLPNLEVLSLSFVDSLYRNDQPDADGNPSSVERAQREVVRCKLWEALPKLTKICLIGPFVRNPDGKGTATELRVSCRSRPEFQRKEDQLY